jgi:hypothetical protein
VSEHRDLVEIGDYTFDLAWLMSSALVGVPLDKSFLRELEIRVGTEFRSKGQVVDFLSRFFCIGLREEWLLDELGYTDNADRMRGSTQAFNDGLKAQETIVQLDNFTHSEPSPGIRLDKPVEDGDTKKLLLHLAEGVQAKRLAGDKDTEYETGLALIRGLWYLGMDPRLKELSSAIDQLCQQAVMVMRRPE